MNEETRLVVEQALTLITFAVHEHVESNGLCGAPFKSDPGWEDAHDIMEKLEAIVAAEK